MKPGCSQNSHKGTLWKGLICRETKTHNCFLSFLVSKPEMDCCVCLVVGKAQQKKASGIEIIHNAMWGSLCVCVYICGVFCF